MALMEGILKFIALCLVMGCAPGCSTVTLSSASGKAEVRGAIGTQLVELDSYPLVVTTQGFGIFTKPDGLTIGWINESRVHMSRDESKCRAVIITNRPDEIRNLIQSLSTINVSLAEICVVNQASSK